MVIVSVFSILYPTIQGGGESTGLETPNRDIDITEDMTVTRRDSRWKYGRVVTDLYNNGQESSKKYYKLDSTGNWEVDGVIHRERGPAITTWYKNGQIKSKEWYINGVMHRERRPAIITWHQNGTLKSNDYYKNGKLYRKKPST